MPTPLSLRALALGLLALCGFSASLQADTIVVQANGFNFIPAHITIQEGDKVRWVEAPDFFVHSITEGNDGIINFDEAFHGWVGGINPTFYEVTFDAALLAAHPRPGGVYDYFCEPHYGVGMVGTVRVVAAPSDPGAPLCFGDGTGAPCPCNNTGTSGAGCANSTGQGALLTASGSSSVAASDLVLRGSQLVPNTPGLYFQGTILGGGGNGTAFGDGLLCANGMIQRLEVRISSPLGASQTTVNVVAEGSVSAGQTRFYQLWYRNTVGSPCGQQFNTSNAYRVDWL